ncbi:MAG: hypothetical protein L6408_07640 [Nanoarchaeota archaeon]|nr:hypothetical protein [Nanoarchaeota archaeon]
MKMYRQFKGMNKKAKICLAGTILYTAATIALPVYASVKSENTSLENLATSEQVKTVYDQKIKEYTADKELKQDEIRDLDKIISRGSELEDNEHFAYRERINKRFYSLKEQVDVLTSGKEDLLKPVYDVDAKLTNEKNELKVIEKNLEVEDNHRKVFDSHEQEIQDIRTEINRIVNIYYPGLLMKDNADYNVIYNPHERIDIKFSAEFRRLIQKRADPIFRIVFHNNDLDYFDDYRDLRVRDILIFREIINEDYEVKFDSKGYGFMMQNQLRVVSDIEQKKKQIKAELNPRLIDFNQKITDLEKELVTVKNEREFKHFFQYRTEIFSSYMEALRKRQDFVEQKGIDCQDYWVTSFFLAEGKMERRYNDKGYNFGNRIKNLEAVLARKGLKDIDVEDITNPTRARFPLWAMLPLSIGLSVLRRTVLRAYVIKRKDDPVDVLEPIMLGIMGPMILDALHPVVFPLRNIAVPFIEEPLRKVFGLSKPIKKSRW